MIQFKDLKEGEALSETQFYTVIKKEDKKAKIQNDQGEIITVDDRYVENCLTSASQFSEEKKVSKTEAATIFLANPVIVMSVNYNKKVDDKVVKESLYSLYTNKGGKVLSEVEYKKKVDNALKGVTEGEKRTMIGRHLGDFNELGRVNFIDMEIKKDLSKTYDNRTRQVDPRTINWMIIKNVKYITK